MARPEWCPQCDVRRLAPALIFVPQPPAPPTPEQIAREVLAWLIEGKEIGLHAVAVKLALSRQDDESCRRWAEQARAYLRETGQEEDGDASETHQKAPSRPATPSGVLQEHPRRQEGAVEALARARVTLQHLNDWATMDREGERFPWIANETAAALEGLK